MMFRKEIAYFLIMISMIFLLSFSFQTKPVIFLDKKEAKVAFNYLKQIRENPKQYFKQLGYDSSLNVSKRRLIWNDTLASVAEAKAYDMAKRNYLGHVTPEGVGINYMISQKGYALLPEWLKDKKDNFFESISGGAKDGHAMIDLLIIDKDEPTLGHRKHLMGLTKFTSGLVDVGIGFARIDSGATYLSYASVIIAKHKW